jgi:transcriptional regulator
MYRPRAFVEDDVAVLRDFIRERAFATVAMTINGAVHFAYTPVVLDGEGLGRLRFHLAKANPVCTAADGAVLNFSFLGDDAYISPDWYDTQGRVPTWNYTAVEASGRARKLAREELLQLLVDISADQENRLLPKAPWKIEKVDATKLDGLLNAIDGFEVVLESLEGKFKLSQNVTDADKKGAIAGLEDRTDPRSLATARAMRSKL